MILRGKKCKPLGGIECLISCSCKVCPIFKEENSKRKRGDKGGGNTWEMELSSREKMKKGLKGR